MSTHLQPVLIGVDDSPATDAAVRAGMEEARRLDAWARLVHVVPDRLGLVQVGRSVGRRLTDRGSALLERVAGDARLLAPDIEVETQLRWGGAATELAEAAAEAAVLYVGRDGPLLERPLEGTAGAGAAARASCPVVSVPTEWSSRTGRGDVVVAVKSPGSALELLADAFAEAVARRARVVVLHSWRLPGVYDDIIVSRVAPEEATRGSTEAIDALLRESRLSYPDVDVAVRIVHDRPVHALVAASRSADLLVLARRPHGVGLGTLGGTGRAVLRGAECPVRVIPPAR
ncbi:universal stress protein [Nocardioides sp. cx-173]|uniref:universal stress protein n=1 Tax=Nocardioides sp. cx-173 TaxID=2898796 RepID=UPI001E58AFA5|nr:universal stress protein [Nocardioides sp. cx-173]MCD4523924.1 universal stress protein [Nocardioides sp. cx-173]UGB41759.1 universal stress protein [Nocardioides sp. cx-173]